MPKPHYRPGLLCTYCRGRYNGNSRTEYCSDSCKVRHANFKNHGKGYAPGDPRINSYALRDESAKRGVDRRGLR